MINHEFNEKRKEVVRTVTAAAQDWLAYMGSSSALAAVPDTDPPKYVAVGPLKEIAKLLPAFGDAAEQTTGDLTDERIEQVAREAVAAGKLSWTGFEEDERGFYTVPILSKCHYQFARVIECAAIAAHLASQSQAEPSKPTDISQRLREYAGNPGYSHNDYADTMHAAAEEIERYYGGMLAWKRTAEKKDRDWSAERMDRINDRLADQAQPSINVERLTNEEIDIIWRTMPGGPAAWLKSFGYQQFAKAIEDEVILSHERAAHLASQSQATKVQAAPIADLSEFTERSIREHADFRDDIERLSTADSRTRKALRKEIYDTIDARVRNAVKAALDAPTAQEVTQQAAPFVRAEVIERFADYSQIAHLIGIIFFAGDFKAETANERALEALLIKTGHRYASWEEIDSFRADDLPVEFVTQQAAKAETAEQANVLPPTRGGTSENRSDLAPTTSKAAEAAIVSAPEGDAA